MAARRASLNAITNIPDTLDEWVDGLRSNRTRLPTETQISTTVMDQFLQSKNLFRYHLPIDGSCLFRAVSEVLFGCQNKHAAVRMRCCDYIMKNRNQVKSFFNKTTDLQEHVERLRESQTLAGYPEMRVLSIMYKVDFVIYSRPDREPMTVTQNGFDKEILLCWSHGGQYDLVYSTSRLEALTVSQAVVYDILYKDVFDLGKEEVEFVVTKMLYDKESFKTKRHLTFTQWCQSVNEGDEKKAPTLPEKKGEQIVLSVRCGVPPFPFKVAKCLDPNLFRNVDYLNWCEEKREEYRTGNLIVPALDCGVKCLARIGNKEHTGFVQSIDYSNNCAKVFLQSIGEIRNIPLTDLESYPVNRNKMTSSHKCDFEDDSPHTLKTSTPISNKVRSRSAGDALTNITHDQFKQLCETSRKHETFLSEIPEVESRSNVQTTFRRHSHAPHPKNHLHKGRENRRGSQTLDEFYMSNVGGQPTPYVPYYTPASVQSYYIDSPYHYSVLPPENYIQPTAQYVPTTALPTDYSAIQVASINQFDPSKPPPKIPTIQITAPIEPIECTQEFLDSSFTFNGPPKSSDVSSIKKSVKLDGSDLPYKNMDLLRYFFNLGVSTYQCRKQMNDSVDANDSGFVQNNTVIMPPCHMVPQQGIVYPPTYATIAPATTYYTTLVNSFSEFPQPYDIAGRNLPH